MKIGYVVAGFPLPSETFVFKEIMGLRALGLKIEVYAISGPSPEQRRGLSPDMKQIARRVHYVGQLEMGLGLARALASRRARKLNARLDREVTIKPSSLARLGRAGAIALAARRAGIEHLHAHWPYGTQIALLVHEMTRLPMSVSIHAHEVAHDNGHFAAVFERIRFAAFCNQAGMRYLLDRLPAGSEAKSALIYHGVELQKFSPAAPAAPVPPLRVLSAGRLTRTKGFDRLIRALASARAQDLDVRLTLMGDGAERAALEALARALEVADALDITGWVPFDRVQDHYARSHVFALLADTTYHDGLPNVVLEAMASARPVILSPLPAAREAVDTGCGFVLERADATEDLVSLWGRLLAEPDLVGRMGQAARAAVAEKFDADAGYQKLYESITEGHW